MSDSRFRMDITLPFKNWGESKNNYQDAISHCEDRLKKYRKICEDKNTLKISDSSVIFQRNLHLFCRRMFRSAQLYEAEFKSVIISESGTTFVFILDSNRVYDKFYYNLIYLLAKNGILRMKSCIKKSQRNTE